MADELSEAVDATLEVEVQVVFEDFWASIVCPGGEWDVDQVKRELHDFHMMLTEVPKVYYEITQGRISKPHTLASEVLAVHAEACHRDCGDDDDG